MPGGYSRPPARVAGQVVEVLAHLPHPLVVEKHGPGRAPQVEQDQDQVRVG